jgi:hypothetical protein
MVTAKLDLITSQLRAVRAAGSSIRTNSSLLCLLFEDSLDKVHHVQHDGSSMRKQWSYKLQAAKGGIKDSLLRARIDDCCT